MANQITDNRTQLADADNITDGISGSWTGSTSVAQDTTTFIEGAGSITEQMTNSERTILWNAGTTVNLNGQHIYIWVNCGVVGLLLAKASGGFKIRFAGPTVTNYFDAWVGGNDDWPNSVAGGWVQFVLDVTATRASAVAAGHTGGTPPADTAIQHIGVAATTSAMTKVADNTWVDAIWRLPASTPGIIIEGRNAGTTPWSVSDIFTQLGISAGSFRPGAGGSWVCNTPVQIGINDTTTHEFSDTNELILWDNQEFVGTTLYGISALGNAGGTTNVTLGVKSGSGDSATGAQGLTFQAAAAGVRFYMDFDDPNIDSIGLYGCTFKHGSDFQLDDAAVESISCLFLDCTSAAVSNSRFQRNQIVDPNVTSGVAFVTTDDFSDIKYCDFQSSGNGHAIELLATSPIISPQADLGNVFTGYSASPETDAAIYNNTGNAITVNVTDAATPSHRNGAGASTTFSNNISVTITGLQPNSEVRVYYAEDFTSPYDTTEIAGVENVGSPTEFQFSAPAGTVVDIVVFHRDYVLPPNNRIKNYTVPTSSTEFPVSQIPDRNFSNPV